MKRILFLDIDGVANCERFRRAAFTEAIALVKGLADERLIDPERVARLNAIVEATGAEVVISSDWRLEHPHPLMAEMLARRGFTGTVIGETERKLSSTRAIEIRWWVQKHKPDRYVALDDIPLGNHLGRHFVHVKDGLEDRHVELAIEVLR